MRLILLLISVLLTSFSFGQIKSGILPLKDLLNNQNRKIKKTNPGCPDSSRFSIKEAFGDSSNTYTIYTYNNNKQVIKEDIRYEEFNGPTLYFMDSFVYDGAGRLIAEYNFELSGPNGARTPLGLYTTNYDQNTGLRLSRKSYNYSNGNYTVASGDSSLYSYDNEGRSTGFEVRQFGAGGEMWGLTNKVEINYIGSNLMPNEYVISFYNSSSQSFVLDQKLSEMAWRLGSNGINSFLYNSPTEFKFYYHNGSSFIPGQLDTTIIINSKKSAYLSFTWDGNNIDSLKRIEYLYDTKGNLISEKVENYNSNSEWELEILNKDSIIYGKFNIYEEKYNTNIFNDIFQGLLISNSYWDYYYPANLSNNKIGDKIVVYPNPTRDLWIVDLKGINYDLKLFDIQGKEIKVKYEKLVDRIEINAIDLIEGIYFLQLMEQNKFQIIKVSKY